MAAEGTRGELATTCQSHGKEELIGKMFPHGHLCREITARLPDQFVNHGLGSHTFLPESAENFGNLVAADLDEHGIPGTGRHDARVCRERLIRPWQHLLKDGELALGDVGGQVCQKDARLPMADFASGRELKLS